MLAAPCAAQQKGWHVLKGGFRFLNDIHFNDADSGYVVGFNTTALRTTDGGANWKQMPLPKGLSPVTVFSSIAFSSKRNGCITFGDSILHTSDGGVSWSRASVSSPATISKIVWPSALVGYATGGSINGGSAILKTTDGGASWSPVHPPSDAADLSYWGADFRDAQHGMVIVGHGDPLCYDLWRTSDAGQSWERITQNVIDSCAHDLTAITHVTGTTWVIGGNSIQRTSDDGATWTKVSILPRPTDISFADSLVGYAGGNLKGVIYKTRDGGRSWLQTPITADSPATVNALSAPQRDIAFAIGGYYPTNLHDDIIIKTVDGGGISAVDEHAPLAPGMLCVYPNPASTQATVMMAPASHTQRFVLVDALGRIAMEDEIPADTQAFTADLATLRPGLYWGRVGEQRVRIGIVR